MADDIRCVHKILNEAAHITRTEDADNIPRLDATASAIRDFLVNLHVESNDPQIIEAVAAGVHIGCIRFAGYLRLGLIPEVVNDTALEILGEIIQALSLTYTQPGTPTAAEMNAAFETSTAGTVAPVEK